MSKHEQFEELCALAATGQLAPEEEQRLSDHLDACPTCRSACDEFSVILRELPTSDRDILEHNVV
ncbi:MAG: zf-HC2 domain-containing protein, partial [Candidatus Sulfotelmatobacter sp.]